MNLASVSGRVRLGRLSAGHGMVRLARLSRRVGWLSAVFLLLALVPGCDKGLAGFLDTTGVGATLLPGVKLNLPPPPSFAEPNIPREYPDGSVSIYGMGKEFKRYSDTKNKYIGQKVKVKAYLLEVYKCPVCPKGQQCKQCEEPHMYASDELNGSKEKGLLIAEYRGFRGREPKLTIGKQYVFEGVFNQSSPKGFTSSDGLLVYHKMLDDTNKEHIGPAEENERQAALAEAAALKAMGQRPPVLAPPGATPGATPPGAAKPPTPPPGK